jgi:parallel beta-helix repeat protein
MRKQLELLSLLAVIILGTLTVANRGLFSPANATYVEGPITQDTYWTLTDSPFVLSKDVVINPGASLTIEPGVEVRFGGYFSIIVEGRLYAVGTLNNKIVFTSNKDQPTAGDWVTLNFTGTAQSTLVYCVLEYASNGVTVEDSNVEIKNSEISTNSQNGVAVFNSTVKIQESEIHDNLNSGIYLTGGNQVTIQNNTISANANGVTLTGNSTQVVNITQNRIQSNSQSGIDLDMNDYSNIVILYNTLSANNKGFYVTGQANTQITNNSISYNNVGFFYERGVHIARWNDIYENEMAMDISDESAIVNAEYNYWGDETGPYHASLNPHGKGNQVGGDGRNLDFIFFLSAPIGYINQRPVARLLSDKTLISLNQEVTFIGTTSTDDRRVDKFWFDFGDGNNSGWTTLTIFEHKYSSVGMYQASLRVMDDFAVISNNSATVQLGVQALSPIETSITINDSSIYSTGPVPISVNAKIGASPVVGANMTLFSIIGGSFMPLSGFTDSAGYFNTVFTAPNITKATYVRIIARASKSGYADGSDYKYLQVLPLLSVQATANPSVVKSKAATYVLSHVTCNGEPISDVAVRLSANNGSFSAETGYTDINGDFAFNFTAPQTTTQINISITATATKSGYFENQGQVKIVVNPRVLSVQVTNNPVAVESRAGLQLIARVTEDAVPVTEANITMSSNLGGGFAPITGLTDSNGTCAFTFTAPEVTTQQQVVITTSATKNGYVTGTQQTTVIVNPAPGAAVTGLPLTMILLIVVAAIIVAIIAVLIKMKIIVISREESEGC